MYGCRPILCTHCYKNDCYLRLLGRGLQRVEKLEFVRNACLPPRDSTYDTKDIFIPLPVTNVTVYIFISTVFTNTIIPTF